VAKIGFVSQNETRDDVLKQCLTSKENQKRYLTTLRKMNSMVLLKSGKNDGITVYVPKETILKIL
jgi:hypothetical protein